MYWENKTRYPPIADIMPRNRFETIKNSFHVAYNNDLSSLQGKKARKTINCLNLDNFMITF